MGLSFLPFCAFAPLRLRVKIWRKMAFVQSEGEDALAAKRPNPALHSTVRRASLRSAHRE
jgi:hypothetical protein